MQKVSIIGVGRVGGALAISLFNKGYKVENLVVKNDETAQKVAEFIDPKPQILSSEKLSEIKSDIVFIATQDSEIENAAQNLAKQLQHKPFVFHTSGSLSSEILQTLKEIGCKTGSIHPLVSVSDAILGAERFAEAYFCVEGDAEAVEAAKNIVADLGGKSFFIETRYKTLYHASAVTACGHLVAVIDVALEMLTKCGLDEDQAQETLLPLIKSTVENLENQTTSEALTGTFARADVMTFRKHLRALNENVSDEAREIYLQLGARSAHLAEMQGANKENLDEIRREISLAKNNFKC
jgi:predicted short-subunit dehydrogenase-like oxidoreductase (DUF2520 family)